MSVSSKPSELSDEDLDDLDGILGLIPEDPSDAAPVIVEDADEVEESPSLNSSFHIDPSGTIGQEDQFHPGLTSSPARSQESDSVDDPANQSMDSISALLTQDEVLPGRRRVEQSSGQRNTASSSAPPSSNWVEQALRAAGIPADSGSQLPPSLPSQASGSEALPAIPTNLESLLSMKPSSEVFQLEKVDWRVAEEPMISAYEDANGEKFWVLQGGPDGHVFTCKKGLFTEKPVSGKTLIALSSEGQQFAPLVAAFRQLKQPSEPGLIEPEQRRMRRSILTSFLAQASSHAKALGEWKLREEGNGVEVGRLPVLMQEVLEQKRQARPSSPPHSFDFFGEQGSELDEFFKAVYTPNKDLKAFLGWGDYLNADRLPEPGSSTTLETIRKDLAMLARPLQCSLAAADLAMHQDQIGFTPEQAGLRSLIQVLGVLSTESALALLPGFDRQCQLYAAEKKSLREKVLKDVKPPSTSIALLKANAFSPGLFPEKRFREVDVSARDVDAQSHFPHFQAKSEPSTSKGSQQQRSSFKRPLPPQTQVDNAVRKRTKPSLPNHQAGSPYSWKANQPSTSKGFFPGGKKQGQQSSNSGGGRNKLPAEKAAPSGQGTTPAGGKHAQLPKAASKGQSKRK